MLPFSDAEVAGSSPADATPRLISKSLLSNIKAL